MAQDFRRERFREQAPGVAPVFLIRDDFRALESSEILRTSADVEQFVFIQTVEGHSHSGYGPFNGRRYPNTTLDDVSRALMLSPREVKTGRQNLIDDIQRFARRVIDGERPTALVNEDGEPLLGIGFFRSLEVNPREVLQGLYIGGLRDTFVIRKEAQEKYRIPIGYGKCYPVNRRVMNEMNLNGAVLAREPHGDEIGHFRERGLITGKIEDDDVSYMFIRHRSGMGASDDAAIVMTGKLFGLSAALGCFLADAVDTLEKYALNQDDQDANIGSIIADSGYDLGITRDDAVDVTYLANIPAETDRYIPDSSLQEMLSVDRMLDQCPLESHLLYVQGKSFAPQDLGRGKTTNIEFYEYIEERLNEYKNHK